jgi:hypothetical protein
MADSPAVRAKRSRRHKAGDHSLCRSETCDGAGATTRDVEPPVTQARDVEPPVTQARDAAVTRDSGRGARLWAEMDEGRGLEPTHRVLLEEACRVADRLDRLDAMLEDPANAWLRFDVSDDGAEITVVVDKLLSEARMQETALKQLVAEIRQAQEGEGAVRPPAPATQPATGGGGGNVVPLRDRVAAKRAQPAG